MDVSARLLEEMSVPEAGIRRVRMSWDEYLDLSDQLRADWVDGEVVVSPRPSLLHGAISVRLAVVLSAALSELEVVGNAGVWLPGNRLRGPDLIVVAAITPTRWVEDPPILVVEILSPSTRSEDLLRKGPEYAAAGIGQFWVVDPEARSLEVFANADDETWESLLRLDDQDPVGEVSVGEHGVVSLDLTSIVPRLPG